MNKHKKNIVGMLELSANITVSICHRNSLNWIPVYRRICELRKLEWFLADIHILVNFFFSNRKNGSTAFVWHSLAPNGLLYVCMYVCMYYYLYIYIYIYIYRLPYLGIFICLSSSLILYVIGTLLDNRFFCLWKGKFIYSFGSCRKWFFHPFPS